MKTIQLTQGFVVTVDDDWYERLMAYKWCAKFSKGNVYAVRLQRKNEILQGGKDTRKVIRMHRVIAGVDDGKFVDHINRNTLDNRRENLRIATNAQNQQNKKTPKHNTSGYRGVTWSAVAKKWQAAVSAEGKRYHIGYFECPEEAYKAYLEKAKQLHGEFFFTRIF